ncbi:MAG TPA: FAD-dependent oxidoreductase [Candidatus Saccharimonadales bacterium]
MSPRRIIIVGGGFGGVRLALNLSNDTRFDVKLISDHTYFEYHAALYRSATGRSPLEVAIPLKDFFENSKNIEVVNDQITDINPDKKQSLGVSGSTWTYDVLVLAVGSVTAYYQIRGLKKYSYGVKSIHEALELKRHLHDSLIKGYEENDYVVVGAGATGVELAAELTAYLSDIRRRHQLPERSFRINLIEAGSRVMPLLPASFSRRVQRRLKRLGVNLYLGMAVKSESYKSLKLPTGSIDTRTVVWTAGMTNNPLFAQHAFFKLTKGNKVEVDDHLQAVNDVFIIGDSAATKFSGMAQTALHDANYLADNLKRVAAGKPPQRYQPKRPIYAIPVGPRWSAVRWGRAEIYGRIGWLLRRVADLRLYWRFLPLKKALSIWNYGIEIEEDCEICAGSG